MRSARTVSRECARHPGEPPDPPPRVLIGGAHSLSGSGMLDGWGELRRPLPPAPLPPPEGSARAGGGNGGSAAGATGAGRPPGRPQSGGGGVMSPSPPSASPPSSFQGLADVFGAISRKWMVARAGVPASGVGTRRPPGVTGSSTGGAGESDRPPPHRGRLRGGRGGDVRRSGRAGPPPPPGAVTGHQGESLPPSPPQKRAQRAGGERVGQPRRPMQTLCDEHRAPACKSCKGHRGLRHCCNRHHEGHPRVLGGGQRCMLMKVMLQRVRPTASGLRCSRGVCN